MFHTWMDACMASDTEVSMLTGTGDGHGIYKAVTGTAVRFHLWWRGHHELVSKDYAGLMQIFEMREKNGNTE